MTALNTQIRNGFTAAVTQTGFVASAVKQSSFMLLSVVAMVNSFAAMSLCAVVLAGCSVKASETPKAGTQVQKNAKPNAAAITEFNTNGKPTKTIETPQGPREIYNPAEDEEVRAAIKNLYSRQNTSFGEVSRSSTLVTTPVPLNEEIELIKTARRTNYFDMLRLGCKQPVEVPCQYYGTIYFINACQNLSFGSSQLNECEQGKVTTDFTDVGGPATIPPKKRDHLKGKNPVYNVSSYECTIDGIENAIRSPLFIGAVSGYSLEETTRLLTTVECLEWSDSY